MTKDEGYAKIYEKKKETTPEQLCEGMPEEILELYKYIKSIKFEERPNYKKCIEIVEKCMDNNGIDKENFKFDWIIY